MQGNGTQSIAWQINEETYRKTLEDEACEASQNDPGLMVYYGSIHDVLSYPCEVITTGFVYAGVLADQCQTVGRQSGIGASCFYLHSWSARSTHREYPPGTLYLRRRLLDEVIS